MKKFCYFTFMIFLLLVSAAVLSGEARAADDGSARIAIAIYGDDRSENGMTENDARMITNALTNGLTGVRGVRFFERRQLDAVLDELGNSSVAMDQNTIMELGKLAGVQYVLIGSLDFLGREENISSLAGIGGGTITEHYEISIRLLDVTTGEVLIACSEPADAVEKVSTFGRDTGSTSKVDKTTALREKMPVLTKKVRSELENWTMFNQPGGTLLPEANTAASLPPQQQQTPQPTFTPPQNTGVEYENDSLDPATVINKYPLDAGQKNMLRLAHINAKKLKGNQAIYDKYVELAESYNGDYLAAYEAGQLARKLRKNDDAIMWYDRALAINPNYVPAQRARMLM